jgi:hypothetical protein
VREGELRDVTVTGEVLATIQWIGGESELRDVTVTGEVLATIQWVGGEGLLQCELGVEGAYYGGVTRLTLT